LIYLNALNRGFLYGCNMIVPMANRHRVAGLIWAAILVIAVQFVTNAAVAHAGHHHHDQHAAHQQGSLTVQPSSEQGAAGYRLAKLTATSKTIEVALMAVNDPAGPAGLAASCIGGCGGSGLGCCSAAAIAGSALALARLDSPGGVIAFKPVKPGSIDPEALAKPPKNLA
jgi:hypothetical protein